jgi:alpha-galactosidase
MKALADYIHSKGLRIGIYTSPGAETCGHHPGSRGHLEQDVSTYARWGMDFVKYDWCMFKNNEADKQAMFQTEPAEYTRMSQLMKNSPRAMVHQICQYGEYNVWSWGARAGGQLWRTNNDVADVWPIIIRNGFENMRLTRYQSRGHWNDLDMLMIGKSNWPSRIGQYDIPQTAPRPTQLNRDEQYTHITLWSLMASPLIFSGDLNQIDTFTKSLLINDEVLAVDQDPLGSPAQMVNPASRPLTPVIKRRLIDGSLVVGLFNIGPRQAVNAVSFAELGLSPGPKKLRDLWQHTEGEINTDHLQWNVAPHGVAFFKITD